MKVSETQWYKLSPEIEAQVRENLNALLERRFAHNDFWQLSRTWKLKHIDQVVSELIMDIEVEITRALLVESEKNNA